MEVADGIVLKLLFGGFAPFFARGQAADAVALKTAVQGGAAQVGNGLLQGVEAIVERQQGLLAEQDDGGFFGRREHGGGGFGAAHGLFGGGAAAPLGDRFLVDAEAFG